jgi:putative hydrolase of the HAD superfamily
MTFAAVLFDLGGVVIASPMARFAAYEQAAGLPVGAIRRINSTNPDSNAWARAERGELDLAGFLTAFESDAREHGLDLDAHQIVEALQGEVFPEMLAALPTLRQAGLRLAAVTNNMAPLTTDRPELRELLDQFEIIVESSIEGVRKPEPAFYRIALERLGVPPEQCIYLDDLGINLKPARAMGMTTIKVVDIGAALAELEQHTGIALR